MLNLKRVSLKLKPCDFEIKPVMISGKEVLPIVEGGKGVSISTGETSGAFAAAGGLESERSATDTGRVPREYPYYLRTSSQRAAAGAADPGGKGSGKGDFFPTGGAGRV